MLPHLLKLLFLFTPVTELLLTRTDLQRKGPRSLKSAGLFHSDYARAVVRVLKPDPTFGLFNGKLF